MALLEGKKAPLFPLQNRTSMEREAVGDWIPFRRSYLALLRVSSEAGGNGLRFSARGGYLANMRRGHIVDERWVSGF